MFKKTNSDIKNGKNYAALNFLKQKFRINFISFLINYKYLTINVNKRRLELTQQK